MKKAKVDWKSLSGKKKAEYIWDYYKIHILVGIFVLVLGVYSGVKIATHRDPLVNIIMLDCEKQSFDSGPVFEEFLTEWGYEVYKEAVNCNSNLSFYDDQEYDSTLFSSAQYENGQLLQTYHAFLWSNEYDLVMGSGSVFEDTADGGRFANLAEWLPEDTLKIYEDDLTYTDEEGTVDPYPCAIRLSAENGWLQEHGLYETCSVGILKTTANPAITTRLVLYLLAENLEPLT